MFQLSYKDAKGLKHLSLVSLFCATLVSVTFVMSVDIAEI